MKKLFTLLFLVAMTTPAMCQELGKTAKILEKSSPESFKSITEFSVNKWGTNESKVIEEINIQSESALGINMLLRKAEGNQVVQDIIIDAIAKHSNGNIESINTNNTIDWHKAAQQIIEKLE